MGQQPTSFPHGMRTPLVTGGGALSYNGGKNFFVGGTTAGAAGKPGTTPGDAVATIAQATALCTASAGDVVHVLPGHTLSGAAAGDITFDKAGVTYIGYGDGTTKPTITLGTDAGADIDIDAINVTLINFRFVSNIDSLAIMLDVNQGNFRCYNCDFVSSSALECLNFVNLATTKDDFHFAGCTFYQPTDVAGTTNADDIGCFYFEDVENILIEDCHFYSFFESAIFHNKTTKAINFYVKNCTGYNDVTDGEVYAQVAAMTGGEVNCLWTVPASAAMVETALIGTASVNWFSHNSHYGNDSVGGDAAAALLVAAS